MSIEESKFLVRTIKNFQEKSYYEDNENDIREYHIDTHPHLQNYIAEPCKIFGGNLSVRKKIDQRPVIIVGQDESTFHQYIFLKRRWK